MSDVKLEEMSRPAKLGCAALAPYRKYNINKIVIQVGTNQVPIGDNVNGFTVKNAGNTVVMFNKEPLQPDESQSIGGNEGEIYVGRVEIYFTPANPPAATPVNMAWVTVKYYP